MAGTFKLKPANVALNRGHPLALKLGIYYVMNEGQDFVLRNLGPVLGTPYDTLIPATREQTFGKDDTVAPSTMLRCENANNSNGGRFRNASSTPDFGGAFSLATRIQPRGQSDSYGCLLSLNNSNGWYMRGAGAGGGTDGKLSFYTGGDNLSTTQMVNTATNRTWYAWATTHSQAAGATGGNHWLNGVLDATYNAGLFGSWSPNNMFNDSGNETYAGLMDYFCAWYRVLTPGEVLGFYNDPYQMLVPLRKWYLSGVTFSTPRVQASIW